MISSTSWRARLTKREWRHFWINSREEETRIFNILNSVNDDLMDLFLFMMIKKCYSWYRILCFLYSLFFVFLVLQLSFFMIKTHKTLIHLIIKNKHKSFSFILKFSKILLYVLEYTIQNCSCDKIFIFFILFLPPYSDSSLVSILYSIEQPFFEIIYEFSTVLTVFILCNRFSFMYRFLYICFCSRLDCYAIFWIIDCGWHNKEPYYSSYITQPGFFPNDFKLATTNNVISILVVSEWYEISVVILLVL